MKIALTLLLTTLVVAPLKAQNGFATVASLGANLFNEPSLTTGVGQPVAVGAQVKLLDPNDDWYVVRIQNHVGWMHSSTLRLGAGASSVGPRSSSGAGDGGPQTQRLVLPPSESPITPTTRAFIRGPRGGCYYISGSGRKVYVDRSLCN